jgi:hypothetical protein
MANRDEHLLLQQMRAAYAAGDVRTARHLAATLSGQAEATRLLERTAVDPRATLIGAAAFGLGLVYVIAFLLLR